MGAARWPVGFVGGHRDCPDRGPTFNLRGGANGGGWPFEFDLHFDYVGGPPASSGQDSRRAGGRDHRRSIVPSPELGGSSPALADCSGTPIVGSILGRESV